MYRLTNIDKNRQQYTFSHKRKTTDNSERNLYFFIVWKGRGSSHINLEKKFSLNYYKSGDYSPFSRYYSYLEKFFAHPHTSVDSNLNEKIRSLLENFWNLSLVPEQSFHADGTFIPGLDTAYYRYYNYMSQKISPICCYTSTCPNSTTDGGIKFRYPVRASTWNASGGENKMIARHLPKKCKRILIKPFYGYIEETTDRTPTELYHIRHKVQEYRSHTNIHAYGVWGEIGLEILLHRISGSSADTVNIACDLIKLK